jgi:hypothetical protein
MAASAARVLAAPAPLRLRLQAARSTPLAVNPVLLLAEEAEAIGGAGGRVSRWPPDSANRRDNSPQDAQELPPHSHTERGA